MCEPWDYCRRCQSLRSLSPKHLCGALSRVLHASFDVTLLGSRSDQYSILIYANVGVARSLGASDVEKQRK